MNPINQPVQQFSRQLAKRIFNQGRAEANAAKLRRGAPHRIYIAPRNSGPLHGNRATRARRIAGFIAMKTVRASSNQRPEFPFFF